MTTTQKVLSIVGWVGTAMVFAAVAIRFIRPEWDQYAIYAAWGGLALVVLYTLGQWREIVTYFKRRQARYGALATVSVLVALGIVVAVNYLGTRQSRRWDLTEGQQHSLSEQTTKVLQGLDAPVKFTVFDKQTEMERFRNRLDEYAYQSKNVTVDYIDPDTRPVIAKEYAIDQYGTIVVEYKGRRERTTSDAEQDITNAVIKVLTGTQQTVYFLQGHGEKDPTRTERDGYSAAAQTLGRDNYKVEKLVLAQQKDVPAGASIVVIAGPTSDLLIEEADALRRYLTNAGKLMVMADPILEGGRSLPNLEALVKEWGIDLGHNIVVDVSGATNEPSLAVAASYPQHPITDRFGMLTIFPVSRGIQLIEGGANGRIAQPLVETSPRSWAESNLPSLESGVSLDPAQGDKAGPVTLAAAVSAPAAPEPAKAAATTEDAPKPESRVVVFGDSDFPSNAYGGMAGNPTLFANAVNWLAQQENLIAIRPKEASDRRVTVTARQQQGIFLVSVLVVPALVFGAGVYTWWRRR